MELYKRVLELTDANLIRCLPVIILTLIICDIMFRNSTAIKKTFRLVRWIIVLYTFAALIFFIAVHWLPGENFTSPQRSAGIPILIYWLLFASAFILPFTLFFRRPGESPVYLLWIAIMIKIGWYIEQWAIVSTHYHREYSSYPNRSLWHMITDTGILLSGIQSVVLALMFIGVFLYWEKQSQRSPVR